MDRRFRYYIFKSLLELKKKVVGWLRKNLMYCVVWVVEKVCWVNNDDELDDMGDSDED